MAVELELKEGDVYRFHYSEAASQRWRTDPLWCFDGQVVVRKGRLCDTYWGFDASEPRIVTPSEGEMVFVCNLGDVRYVKHYETRQYDGGDVFNLSHQHGCYKLFAVRKDAQPSANRMLMEIRIKEDAVRQEMESTVRHAAFTLVQLGEMRARIEAGDLSKTPWW
jgi:hypothetical protein